MLAATPAAALEPSSLDSIALAARLTALAGDERALQVEFLLHLDVFDRRRAWAEAGHPSLWSWCQQVLHLREGAAWRRIAAMRALRRFPQLAHQLRTGRLCLTTAALLGPVLTDANVSEVVERAAYLSKAGVERLVATLAPRAPPTQGIRKLPVRAESSSAQSPSTTSAPAPSAAGGAPEPDAAALFSDRDHGRATAPDDAPPRDPLPHLAPPRPSVRPVDGETYAVRFNADGAFKAELDALRDLLAHQVPSGDLGAVLRIAVRCAVEKYGKRRGAVAPQRPAQNVRRPMAMPYQPDGAETKPAKSAGRRTAVPAEVRREVWRRDGGRCAWRGPDGHRCGSTWQLELDHVVPVARGGPPTIANLRVTCRVHNQLAAEQAFGREAIVWARSRRARRSLPLAKPSPAVEPRPGAAGHGPVVIDTAPRAL